MKIRRRRLALVGLLLLAGPAVNISIVWLIAANGHSWYAPDGVGAAPPGFQELMPPDWPNLTRFVMSREFGMTSVTGWTGPDSELDGQTRAQWEASIGTHGYQVDPFRVHAVHTRVGYPLKSMWCIVKWDQRDYSGWHNTGRSVLGGIDLPDAGTMPVKPIWPAFIANSLVWAFVLWGVGTMAIVPIGTRIARAIRETSAPKWIARGLCPRCKYDIRDLEICPECGTAIRRKAAAP